MDADEPLLSKQKYSQLREAAVSDGSLVIKACCAHRIRRIPILNQELTFDELCLMMQRLFKHLLSADPNNMELQYKDNENDWIEITDDIDIVHAVSLSSCLTVRVFDRETLPNKLSGNNYDVHNIVNSEAIRKELDSIVERLKSIQAILNDSHADIGDQTGPAKLAEPIVQVKPLTTADMAELLETESISSSRNSSTKVQSPKLPSANRGPVNTPEHGIVTAVQHQNQAAPPFNHFDSRPAVQPPSYPINFHTAAQPASYPINFHTTVPEAQYYQPQSPNAPPHSAGFPQSFNPHNAESQPSGAPILSLPPSLSQTLTLPTQADKLKNLRL